MCEQIPRLKTQNSQLKTQGLRSHIQAAGISRAPALGSSDFSLVPRIRAIRGGYYFLSSSGAPLAFPPRNSVCPLGSVRSRPFARSEPSFD